MKKFYLKTVLMVALASLFNTNLIAGGSQKIDAEKGKTNDQMKNSGPLQTPSMLAFGQDVVISSASENQQDIKIATAFNGWMYAVYTSHGGSSDGIYVRRSTDNGVTWHPLIGWAGNYYSADIAICGNDTNALFLYLTSVAHVGSNYTVWVDQINAATGIFQTEPVNEISTDSIYDVAIAHDFLHPASGTTGYSIEVVFSKNTASGDSIIAYLSVDGGITFNDRKAVDVTLERFGKVAVCYGYSPAASNGRYFVAYEEHGAGATEGHIKTSFTPLAITDPFTIPIYMDSLVTGATWANHAWGPTISAQNSGTDNDSLGLTVIVAWTHNYNGSGDIDAVCSYTFNPTTSPWYIGYIDYLGNTNSQQPDISYDETNNNFLATFWDPSNSRIQYIIQSFNMPTPTTNFWTQITAQYNDGTGTLTDPHPQVVIDPSFTQANFAWIETRSAFATALFDAENSFVGIQQHHQNQFSLHQNFPNPADDYTMMSFNLAKSQQVSLEVYDLVGNRIAVLENNNLDAGYHEVKMNTRQIPAGYYMYTLRTAGEQLSKKLLVVH